MTIVLVHGNPETASIWDLLVARLTEYGQTDVIRLSPPGFGAPVPDGFDATVTGYRDWLIAELERIGRPVDLVGHDWGGGHTVNVAMTRPDLLRSWCSDTVGVLDPDYAWHPAARVWQWEGPGEVVIRKVMTARPGRITHAALMRLFRLLGVDPTVARKVAPGYDREMGACILRLYRSARQPAMARLGANLEAAAARPGLAILATKDHLVGSDKQRRRSAARAGARVEVLDGLGHFWMAEDDGRRAANALVRFWASLPADPS